MSLYLETSPKHCADRGFNVKKLNKRLFWTVFSILISVAGAAVLVYLILHPSKPEFQLKDVGVYRLSLSSPRLLNSTIQFTVLSKNPNARVGVFYDGLRTYAVYKGQQITTHSDLPPFYQGHQDTNLLSAFLYGTGVPVAPSFGYEVSRDQTAGKILLRIKLEGSVRWKVGTWVSGPYHVEVDCAAVLGFPQGYGHGTPSSSSRLMSSMQGTQCSTTI